MLDQSLNDEKLGSAIGQHNIDAGIWKRLKKFIDCLVSGQYIEPSRITSSKRLYYNRHELMKKIRENKTRYSKLTKQFPIDYDNVAGGVAW